MLANCEERSSLRKTVIFRAFTKELYLRNRVIDLFVVGRLAYHWLR